MVVMILSIILIGLATLEGIMYRRKNKNWNKIRLFIGILIICLLLSIFYFITDTTIGMFYVFLSASTYILIGIFNYRSNSEWLKYSSYVIGLPVMLCLSIKAIQNMLINPQYFFLLLLVINFVLSPSFIQRTRKEIIAFAIGIVIAVIVIFSYYKSPGFEEKVMSRQELIAQKYLEELGMYGLDIYADKSSIKLRGEDITVRAYNLSGTSIIMTYKNGKIISYDIKSNE